MYNKLFTKILDSTIWLAPDAHRIVWITFLAAMDEDGFVAFASVANVANRARVSLEAAATAVKAFESPDPYGLDQPHEGRRIERVESGWLVLNAAKYRDMVTRIMVREHTRLRNIAYRDRQRAVKAAVTGSDARDASVTPRDASVTPSDASVTQSEADTEARAEAPSRTTTSSTVESSSPPTKAGRSAAQIEAQAIPMPADWQPNSINAEWMTDAGLTLVQIAKVVEEFVTWARHTGLRKSPKNWQLTFYRNPRVKTAVGSAKAGGKGNGTRQSGGDGRTETPYERAGRRLREWAEREGLDTTVLSGR